LLSTLLNNGYNKHRIPQLDKATPVDVGVEMWVQDISSIAALTSDFQIDLYISEVRVKKSVYYTTN